MPRPALPYTWAIRAFALILRKWKGATMSDESPPQLPNNRSFGVLFTLVFALVGAWMVWRGAPAYVWWLAASGVTLLATLAWPALLTPFNRAWMKLAEVLHRIVSPLVLGLLFYAVITPIGLAKRLTGWNPMRRGFDSKLPSYWIPREPPGPASDSLKNQF